MTLIDWIPTTHKNTKIAVYSKPGDPEDAVRIRGIMIPKNKWVTLSRMEAQDVIRLQMSHRWNF